VGGEEVVEAGLCAMRAGREHDDLDLGAAALQVAGQPVQRAPDGRLPGHVTVERDQHRPAFQRQELPLVERRSVAPAAVDTAEADRGQPHRDGRVRLDHPLGQDERDERVGEPLARVRVQVEHVRLARWGQVPRHPPVPEGVDRVGPQDQPGLPVPLARPDVPNCERRDRERGQEVADVAREAEPFQLLARLDRVVATGRDGLRGDPGGRLQPLPVMREQVHAAAISASIASIVSCTSASLSRSSRRST
jgi:hypothetical protein